FGCEVENVIQNNLTIDGFIFYATLMRIKFLSKSDEIAKKKLTPSMKTGRSGFSFAKCLL
ncbi:hypothetical protein, partial [Brevibacillus agri]|uniref:hypothetical protein n=1 Tax=Brevibacillus agri TaxID=51101 RepID=UPI001EE57A4B